MKRAPFTPEEDAEIMRQEPLKAIASRTGRTYNMIRFRRHVLRHGLQGKPPLDGVRFTRAEIKRLRSVYPNAETSAELAAAFPGRSLRQIYSKASNLSLSKRFLGDPAFCGHMEIVDQIRVRAKQDGLTFRALDRELRLKYFSTICAARCCQVKKPNFLAVLRAVEFFGGKLIVDWQD